MNIKVQRVSTKQDDKTFCLPSNGYEIFTEIEFIKERFEEVLQLNTDLPQSDLTYPKGAPLNGYFKYNNKIYKRK